uniref:adhesion G protein-coupled receptor L2-like n=1 Tax=Styela clava TaxID=7725 RepID=UPI00193AD681|nr:adhesion G protein-coupled receptor L2-like [Styela clava]
MMLLQIVLISCVVKSSLSLSSNMCPGDTLTLKCRENHKLDIMSVALISTGLECEPEDGSSEKFYHNCSSNNIYNSVVERCYDLSTCVLTKSTVLTQYCNWPFNKILKIIYQCQKANTCPREVLAISTQRYSRNLHRRPAAWCLDASQQSGSIYLMPWAQHGETKAVYGFSTLKSFVMGHPSSIYRLPVAAAGTSLVAYKGYLYYIKNRTRDLTKYSLENRRKIAEKSIDDALYNHEIDYSGLMGSSDIDLAIDEKGLWAIYTTDHSEGNLVISFIDADDLTILSTWITDIPKKEVLNAFMVCGNLHVINNKTRRMYKKYDTGSGKTVEIPTDINITLPWQETTSVNYNPRDNTLYVWSTSQAIIFTLDLKTSNEVIATNIQQSSSIQHDYDHERFPTTTMIKNDSTKSTKAPTEPVHEFMKPSPMNCPERIYDDVLWPETAPGKTEKNYCPNGARGSSSWTCMIDHMNGSHWEERGPSFDNCAAWTIEIDKQLQQENSSIVVHKIAQQLSDVVVALKQRETRFRAEDLQHSTEIMNEITNIAKSFSSFEDDFNITQEGPGEIIETGDREKFAQLNQALLHSGSDLVDESMSETWNELEENEKLKIGNVIIKSIEETAFLLAIQDEKMLEVDENNNIISHFAEENNILLEIQVQKIDDIKNKSNNAVTKDVAFPNFKFLHETNDWKNITDSITISSQDIENNQVNGTTKVVFAMYNGLAELISQRTIIDEENNFQDYSKVNSKIISATIQSTDHSTKLKQPALITLEHIQPSNQSHVCVYWNTKAKNLSENWLSDGCTLVSTNSSHTVCSCDHLTSFAVLVNHQGFKLDQHVEILDLLTWIGLSMSLFCLALSIVTFMYFRSLHCTRTTIHTNLCICLFLSQLIFVAGIDLVKFPILCSVVAGALHYCFLATFVWMALEGFQLYVMLIEVFERNTNMAWYYSIGYGIPAIFVALSAGLNPVGYGTDTACWLNTDIDDTIGTIGGFTPFIWAFIVPATLVAVGNVAFLFLTGITMYRHGRKYIFYSKLRAIRSALRGTCALLCLLGTTWVIGILWWWENMITLQYLFCIFNAFQGVYIFVFHCLMHNKVRYEYRKFFSKCVGENYTDLLNSTSLTMKYTGMRRRSSQLYFGQKRKNSSSFKGIVRPNFDDKVQLRRGSYATKTNFNEASKYFTPQDRASMQILLTRRDSVASPQAMNFSTMPDAPPTPHPRTFSTRSCPGIKIQCGSYNNQISEPLKRCLSERRYYRGKYNVPVSEGVSRLLKSASSTHSLVVPSRYLTLGQTDDESGTPTNSEIKLTSSSLPKEVSINHRPRMVLPLLPPSGPNAPIKEFKLVDKRLAKFRRMNSSSSPMLGRSASLNAAEKKRRDLRKLQMVHPQLAHASTSVPDLMSQLSAKIESRDISQVLLMYLDKDGTLNRQKIKEAHNKDNKD